MEQLGKQVELPEKYARNGKIWTTECVRVAGLCVARRALRDSERRLSVKLAVLEGAQ